MDEKMKDEVLKALSEYCERSDCFFCLFCDSINQPCDFKKITGQEPCEWNLKEKE